MYAILEEKEKTEFQRAKVALLCTYGCLSNSTQKKNFECIKCCILLVFLRWSPYKNYQMIVIRLTIFGAHMSILSIVKMIFFVLVKWSYMSPQYGWLLSL